MSENILFEKKMIISIKIKNNLHYTKTIVIINQTLWSNNLCESITFNSISN